MHVYISTVESGGSLHSLPTIPSVGSKTGGKRKEPNWSVKKKMAETMARKPQTGVDSRRPTFNHYVLFIVNVLANEYNASCSHFGRNC